VKPGGCLVTKYGLSRQSELRADHQYTYSFNNADASVHAANITVKQGSYHYNVVSINWRIDDMVLHMGGLHNIENSLVAITIGKHLGISDDKIKAAIADFKGVHRRFEYVLKNDSHVLIDDYAHHPEELRALLSGVKSIFPDEKITLVFQPHLFSRTNDLADGFATSLDMADEVILLPIYPARELPMPGVTSSLLLDKMKLNKKKLLTKEEMKAWVAATKPKILVMAGAGDIDALVLPVKEILEK
jgi:UDP-N-acetylmuramate--alanine ligase